MEKVKEKDLGMIITDKLSIIKHKDWIAREMYNLLRNIKTTITCICEGMMKLVTLILRPRLEYAALVWSSRLRKEVKKLERVQRSATKLLETERTYL